MNDSQKIKSSDLTARCTVRCLSVRDVHDLWSYTVRWVTWKVITQIISLRSSKPQHRRSRPRGTSLHFRCSEGTIWKVAVFRRKPAISLKRGKIGPRLLLITNRKLHTRLRLVPKSTTLDDLQRTVRTLLHNKVFFGTHHENLKTIDPYCQRWKWGSWTPVSGNIGIMRIFAGVS